MPEGTQLTLEGTQPTLAVYDDPQASLEKKLGGWPFNRLDWLLVSLGGCGLTAALIGAVLVASFKEKEVSQIPPMLVFGGSLLAALAMIAVAVTTRFSRRN